MAPEVYWIGTNVVVSWDLAAPDGTPITDAVVIAAITLPDATTDVATVDHTTGSSTYRAVYQPTVAGLHAYRLESAGGVVTAVEGTFAVRAPAAAGVAAPPTLDPATPIGQVRLLIPDKDVAYLLFSDAEIGAFLALESGIKRATASALEVVASNEAMVGKVITTQDLSTDGTKVAQALMARAAELRRQANEDDDSTDGGLDIINFRDPFTRRFASAEGAEIAWQ